MSGSYSSDRLRGARPVGSPRLPAVASTLCDTEFLGGLYVSVGCTDSRWGGLFRDTEFLGVKVCVGVKWGAGLSCPDIGLPIIEQ